MELKLRNDAVSRCCIVSILCSMDSRDLCPAYAFFTHALPRERHVATTGGTRDGHRNRSPRRWAHPSARQHHARRRKLSGVSAYQHTQKKRQCLFVVPCQLLPPIDLHRKLISSKALALAGPLNDEPRNPDVVQDMRFAVTVRRLLITFRC